MNKYEKFLIEGYKILLWFSLIDGIMLYASILNHWNILAVFIVYELWLKGVVIYAALSKNKKSKRFK